MRAADGRPATWGGSEPGPDGASAAWPLPSPASPAFQAEVRAWLAAVRSEVLAGRYTPNGPIVALQVGNEGIYCDAQHAVWAHDYSDDALRVFRAWLRERYETLDAYNAAHATRLRSWEEVQPPRRFVAPEHLAGLRTYTEWSEFAGRQMGRYYADYARLLDAPVPVLANVNPPRGEPWGVDAWLSRVQPDTWGPIQYGYTNWIGIAAEDPSAMARYLVMTRWRNGPNIEENWGFTDPYGAPYAHASACFQQTLLAIAGGAKGYNLYTAVGTSTWDATLDRFQARPYPSHAPITHHGEWTSKASVAAHLSAFFARYGADFAQCRPATSIAWGIYLPSAYWGAWTASLPPAEARAGDRPLVSGGPLLLACSEALQRQGLDLGLVDLHAASQHEMQHVRVLVVTGTPWMDAEIQRRLATYVAGGGRLVILGTAPAYDEHLDSCTVAAEAATATFASLDLLLDALVELRDAWDLPRLHVEPAGAGFAWLLTRPERDTHYLVLLSRETDTLTLQYGCSNRSHTVEVRLAPGSGALLRVQGGALDAAVILGTDESRQQADIPGCRFDGQEVMASAPGDLFAWFEDGEWQTHQHPATFAPQRTAW